MPSVLAVCRLVNRSLLFRENINDDVPMREVLLKRKAPRSGRMVYRGGPSRFRVHHDGVLRRPGTFRLPLIVLPAAGS
jgi:hypothetical protein